MLKKYTIKEVKAVNETKIKVGKFNKSLRYAIVVIEIVDHGVLLTTKNLGVLKTQYLLK